MDKDVLGYFQGLSEIIETQNQRLYDLEREVAKLSDKIKDISSQNIYYK